MHFFVFISFSFFESMQHKRYMFRTYRVNITLVTYSSSSTCTVATKYSLYVFCENIKS